MKNHDSCHKGWAEDEGSEIRGEWSETNFREMGGYTWLMSQLMCGKKDVK